MRLYDLLGGYVSQPTFHTSWSPASSRQVRRRKLYFTQTILPIMWRYCSISWESASTNSLHNRWTMNLVLCRRRTGCRRLLTAENYSAGDFVLVGCVKGRQTGIGSHSDSSSWNWYTPLKFLMPFSETRRSLLIFELRKGQCYKGSVCYIITKFLY